MEQDYLRLQFRFNSKHVLHHSLSLVSHLLKLVQLFFLAGELRIQLINLLRRLAFYQLVILHFQLALDLKHLLNHLLPLVGNLLRLAQFFVLVAQFLVFVTQFFLQFVLNFVHLLDKSEPLIRRLLGCSELSVQSVHLGL